MAGFYGHDKKLKAHAPFKRYKSFIDAGINLSDARFNPAPNIASLIKTYEESLRKQLMARFKTPQLVRSDFGQLVNVDEAYEGIPECYRHTRNIKSVLKLGLNLSADSYASDDIYAFRAAAIIAVSNFAKSRGQNVQFDVCYGVGLSIDKQQQCHIRITLVSPTPNMIARIMTAATRVAVSELALKLNGRYATHYRLHEFKALLGWNEFDFALDRIETKNLEVEKARIYKQIEGLR